MTPKDVFHAADQKNNPEEVPGMPTLTPETTQMYRYKL